MSIQHRDIKLLWGRAANRCAICRTKLAEDTLATETSYPTGQQAHIVAEKPDGPRGQSPLTLEDRNSYHNLILLCPTHHTTIDNNEEDYPVEVLHVIKSRHEVWVEQTLARDTDQANMRHRYLASLISFIDTISPLLYWLHRSVPKERARSFFKSLRSFWAMYNLATEALDQELRFAVDNMLRPLTAENYAIGENHHYARAKLGIANQLLERYFTRLGFDWIELWDAAEAMEVVQNTKLNLERIVSDTGTLSPLEVNVVRHLLFIAKYYESYDKARGHTLVPEGLVQQFFATFEEFFNEDLGFDLPDSLDEESLDIISRVCGPRPDKEDE